MPVARKLSLNGLCVRITLIGLPPPTEVCMALLMPHARLGPLLCTPKAATPDIPDPACLNPKPNGHMSRDTSDIPLFLDCCLPFARVRSNSKTTGASAQNGANRVAMSRSLLSSEASPTWAVLNDWGNMFRTL